MKFPPADRYNEAVQNPNFYFSEAEVKRRRVQSDALGLPEVLSGGFAFTYRFTGASGDIAVRCFHRAIPELFERYRSISTFLASLNSRFFVDFVFAERGVRIDGADLPVVRMRWVEGETLLGYVARRRSEPRALIDLREQLLAFADEAESRGYAHGDVQHRNLMVASDGKLKLVDYDGMFVPALKHLKAADAGHPHFQPPTRTAADYSQRMDRFPLAVIDLSLEALAKAPDLFDRFHRGENLIVSRDDFLNPAASPVLNVMAGIPGLAKRVAAFSDLCGLRVSEMPALREFRAGSTAGTVGAMPQPAREGTNRQAYTSPFDVVDGMNYSQAIRFIGRPVEIIGRVLQVMELEDKGLALLRFGQKYSGVPVVVMPLAIYSRWNARGKIGQAPWISATGVLQTHRSGRYSTVQVLVKEASDVELLANKEEADFRLGRMTRSAPSVPPRSPEQPSAGKQSPPVPPTGQSGLGASSWKITRSTTSDAPQWASGASVSSGHSSQQNWRSAASTVSAPVVPVQCPVCGQESDMPVSARVHQCTHCGVASEAARFVRKKLTQMPPASAGPQSHVQSTPKPPVVPPTQSPPLPPRPSQTGPLFSSAGPASPWRPPPQPPRGPVPPKSSVGPPSGGSPNPWQSAPASSSSPASGAGSTMPRQGSLVVRFAKFLFGRWRP